MCKKLVIAAAVVMLTVPVFGISLGPPKATLPAGDFSAGVDVSHSKMDVKTDFGSVNGITNDTAALVVNYGVFDNVTLTGIIGAGEVDHKQFDAETGLVVGGAVSATFIEDMLGVDIGGICQVVHQQGTIETPAPKVGYWRGFWFWKRYVIPQQTPSVIESDFDFTTIILAAGPTWESGSLTLYGGPLLAYLDGNVETPYQVNIGVDEKARAGVFCGGSYEIWENAAVNIDYVTTGAIQTLGISGSFAF